MTDILGRIDDTLDNWHGSADSMHWTADGNAVVPGTTRILVGANGFRATVCDVLLQSTSTGPRTDEEEERAAQLYLEPFTLEVSFPLAPPSPEMSYWETAAWRRTICDAFQVPPREIGFPPRYGFDARYRQRQRNRRKRSR